MTPVQIIGLIALCNVFVAVNFALKRSEFERKVDSGELSYRRILASRIAVHVAFTIFACCFSAILTFHWDNYFLGMLPIVLGSFWLVNKLLLRFLPLDVNSEVAEIPQPSLGETSQD